MRWEPPERWHVTLRFLGRADQTAVADALAAVPLPSATAVLGPAVEILGDHVLVVPVAGLDDLAASVVAATADLGEPPDPRPFRGHLTVARLGRSARRAGAGLAGLVGAPCSARFTVDQVAVVASRSGPEGLHYDVVDVVPCTRCEETSRNPGEGVDQDGRRS